MLNIDNPIITEYGRSLGPLRVVMFRHVRLMETEVLGIQGFPLREDCGWFTLLGVAKANKGEQTQQALLSSYPAVILVYSSHVATGQERKHTQKRAVESYKKKKQYVATG